MSWRGDAREMSPETLLHRQIHPAFVQKERVTSQAFKPTPKDEQKLSVYDGDQITAKACWEHFTERGFASAGVLSVSVEECTSVGTECVRIQSRSRNTWLSSLPGSAGGRPRRQPRRFAGWPGSAAGSFAGKSHSPRSGRPAAVRGAAEQKRFPTCPRQTPLIC